MKRSTMTVVTLAMLSFGPMGVALADDKQPSPIDERLEKREARREERQERRRVRAGRTTVTLVDDGEAFEDVISRIRAERRQQKADPATPRFDNAEKPLPIEKVQLGGAEPAASERRAELRSQRRDPSRVRERRQRLRDRVREIRANRIASPRRAQ
ncbi:MAG: hypothetical protein SGI86_01125 [Deltaproteobacteria bacterium]|nr:hypothetical protein [Deltaproteobacteria bacterium]